MSDHETPHVLLLPVQNYWAWVGAAREYALQYGILVTPSPENAAQYHYPRQIISVVIGGVEPYEGYGDIRDWLRAAAPAAQIDLIDAAEPDALRTLLLRRMEQGTRLAGPRLSAGASRGRLELQWPTDYREVTQSFGESPQIYRRWGLPGHEGIDFRAPINSRVYACAAGIVYLVHDGSSGHPYGIHVRIRHEDGYSTTYAHLNRALVTAGTRVRAGDTIGLANSTGNAVGSHVHLTLKQEGATAQGWTPYPNDIIDPTPYLVLPPERRRLPGSADDWAYPHCLFGLQARVDGPMEDADWEAARVARIEALKLTSSSAPVDAARALQMNPELFLLVQLSADFRSRRVTPAAFASQVIGDLERFYQQGVRYFEVHHEPNIRPEGYGLSWDSGRAFAEWFLEVVGLLRLHFPDARYGWPGLSPGATAGMRADHRAFLESAGLVVDQADWIGCHCYWQDEETMMAVDGGLGYQYYRQLWPGKLLLITEFCNPSPSADPATKAGQYIRYMSHLRQQERIGAAFCSTLSASAGFRNEVWRTEEGKLTPIPGIIGERA